MKGPSTSPATWTIPSLQSLRESSDARSTGRHDSFFLSRDIPTVVLVFFFNFVITIMYFFQVLANIFFILSMSASCISASAVFCASMSNSTSTLSLSRLFSSCRLAFSRRRRSWSTVPGPELKRLVMDNSDQLIVTLTLAGVIMSTTFCGRQRKSGRLFFRDLLLWCTRIILVDASH